MLNLRVLPLVNGRWEIKIHMTKTNFSPKTNFKQFKVTFWRIGSKTA